MVILFGNFCLFYGTLFPVVVFYRKLELRGKCLTRLMKYLWIRWAEKLCFSPFFHKSKTQFASFVCLYLDTHLMAFMLTPTLVHLDLTKGTNLGHANPCGQRFVRPKPELTSTSKNLLRMFLIIVTPKSAAGKVFSSEHL